jgi:putative transposase
MDTCTPLYATDLTAAKWAVLEPLLPPEARTRCPRVHAWRIIVDAICYVLRTGYAWQTVYHYVRI